MRIRSIVTMLFLLLPLFVVGQNADLQQFEKELRAKNGNVSSIECQFTQTREISVLANIVEKCGEFYFSKPSNMLLSFEDGDYIMMTEEWFKMKTADDVSTTRVSSNPMLRSLSSILSACVVGDFEQMTKGFTISVESKANEWVVVMTPQRGKSASKITAITLHFDKGDMSLNMMKMQEKTGDSTTYKFVNKAFNKVIDSNLFNIN